MSNKIIYHIYRRSTAAPAKVCEHKHCSKFQIDIMMELDIYLEEKKQHIGAPPSPRPGFELPTFGTHPPSSSLGAGICQFESYFNVCAYLVYSYTMCIAPILSNCCSIVFHLYMYLLKRPSSARPARYRFSSSSKTRLLSCLYIGSIGIEKKEEKKNTLKIEFCIF